MLKRPLAVTLLAVVGVACATVPPPATRSPENPAHPEAPEAATPPASPMLMSEPETVPPAPAAGPHSGHEGHGAAETPDKNAVTAPAVYVCPMHANVKSDKPGTCRVCGMTLVRARPEAER